MAVLVMSKYNEVFIPHQGEEVEADHYSLWTDDSDIPQYEEKYVSDGEVFTFPGPLMRTKMQKEKLMRFIQEKCQECLLHLNEPQQQKSYFFWSIMERFCNRNGRVMMSEIGTLLFKGYRFLRRKLQRVENQEDWCLPLANLLCAAAPKDKHREAIIEMGDKFASRGWTYAAHLCYVSAQLDLGLRPRFKVVGCDSLPETKSAMREVIERTEVYEYVLSLTSGFGQTHFQEFKYVHACELADAGLDDLALDYCENVAAAVLTFPECTQSTLMEWVILLSEKLLQMREEEPEWLTKFRQLLQHRLAQCNSSDDQKQISSEAEESDHLLFDPSTHIEFNSLYTVGEPLGEGGFGLVYAGVRKADGKQVAVKCAAKDPYDEFLNLDGESNVPLEVALMKMVSKFSTCENIVELLDWFEASDFYILVLERPVPCMDLYQFCKPTNHRLSEPVARVVMQQVVQAARHCCEYGVLHCDIKPQNILINPDTLTVKLIDFGCGNVLTEGLYKDYAGTDGYYPPEWVLHKEYFGVPATVWSLGVVLFELVCGQLPFISDSEIVEGQLRLLPDLSEECCDLIKWCLKQDPESRPSFMNILSHKWLTEADKATVKLSEELLQRSEEEPEWLTKLCQFLEGRVSHCNSSDDQKQISSEAEESDHLQFDPSIHIEFNSLYTVGEPLGEGGFGLVYAGVRKADGKQVAVKCAAKDPYDEFLNLDGESNVPLEVALMKMVSKFSTCENIVELLDWFEASDFYILVLERPVPCMDLYQFCKPTNHRLSEPVARVVMQQVVQAARHCCEYGVLHCDIKPQNILINPDTLTVKLIDFGCGNVLTEGLYKDYAGTDGYYPPEWVLHKEYFGVPATVWSLGVVLFELVCGQLPFISDSEIVEGQLRLLPDLSEECCDLIKWCLKQDPESRPSFMNILSHKWLTEADKATVKLSEELLQRSEEEPEWLTKLCQFLEGRVSHCNSSDDQKQISSEAEESDHLQFDPSIHIEFNSLYTVGEPLGEGGFGLVYAGVRKADGKQVAVKCAAKDPYDEFLNLDGESNVPLEVALMKMVSKFSTCENIVELLDWFEASDFYILVLERPVPCMDLYQFCKPTNHRLSEPVARVVMQQVVQAARHCCEYGVLHCDIKPQNILINPDTLTVKLIDFGCGNVLTEGLYKDYAGTDGYYPPEWVLHKEYFGVPATVWSLGVVLFELVCGQLPFISDSEIVEGQLRLLPDLSEECCDLIEWCLKQDPESRPSFMNILSHKWLTEADKATVKLSEELLQRREEEPEWLTKLCQFLEGRVSHCNSQ